MAKTVSDQVVDMLSEAGVKRIYAVTGDSLNHVNSAVRTSGKLQWIHVRNEEVGAYAAGAEAQLTGQLACCAGSSGPGHVHLINGLYDAHRTGAPVIAIASTIASQEFGTEYFQETNTIKLFDDCSYFNQVAITPKQFPRMMQAAVQHATQRKGVAVIGLTGDVTEEDAQESETAMHFYMPQPQTRPSDSELQALAEMIKAHDKITIFCGFGASDAHDEVVEFAAKIKAPVGYSYRGKMAIQHNNPYEIGMTGLLGLPSAFKAMHDAELVILLGTDFPYVNFMPTENKIVQIDTKPERLGRRAKLEMGLNGDIKHTLQALIPLLDDKTDEDFLQTQLDFYEKVKQNTQTYVKDRGEKDAIHPEYLAATIDKLATDDAIFTMDTGMCCVWGARYINSTGKRSMIGSFNHGSMANAMPQAIGAALAFPHRQVIAFCGDGGLTMLLGDLGTIVQYKLPVKLIVFNNKSLGMVKLEMEVAGLPDWQTNMVNPDFAAVAIAFGMTGITVNEPENVEQAIRQALATEGPVLVNVMTDPNALSMPPEIEFKQVKGMALSMGKMILNGRVDEVLDTVKSNYKHVKDLL